MSRPRPLAADALVERLADAFAHDRRDHPLRVAVDGSPHAGLDLVTPLSAALPVRGRPVVAIDARDFLRPASLRLERGREDPDAFYEDWLDLGALRREVLEPLGPGGSGRYLPTLWDADRDRATRARYETAPAASVVLVRGWFLLMAADGFDRVVHLSLSAGALRRHTPAEVAERELPAFARYEREFAPARSADVTVRCDDPDHPAVTWRLP